MALTRQDWEQVKDKYIDTKEMLHTHLIGYDILKRMFTDKQMLQYTSNITVESQYEPTCLATYVGENDYKLGVSKVERVRDCDNYGRPIPNKYITVYKYHAYIRVDRVNNYVSEVSENFKGIALSLTNDSKLREFINQVDTSKLYLTTYENSVLYGDIKIDTFRNNFSEYDNLMFHHGDNTGNYFGTYETSTKRMCNRDNYYVNLMKLADHLEKTKKVTI